MTLLIRQPHLRGALLELRPMREDDWGELCATASDPLIWEQHPASDRYQEAVFREYFREGLESGGGLVAIDARSRQAMLNIGGVLTARRMSALLHGKPVESVVFEIRKSDWQSRLDRPTTR